MESAPNYATPWTPDEITVLCTMAKLGMTNDEIALALGRSFGAVIRKRRKLGQ